MDRPTFTHRLLRAVWRVFDVWDLPAAHGGPTGFVFTFILGLTSIGPGHAQNLVPNPDFEVFTICPITVGTGGPMLCPPWNSVETPDYFNACGNLNTGVPFNIQGFQEARSGNGYTGVFARLTLGADNVREYIQVELDEPLVAGTCYQAGCYINLGDASCGIDRFGLLLSEDPIPNPLGLIPQVNPTGTFFTDQIGWMLISGEFIAEGGEQYLTIGNFADDANTQFDPPCDEQGAIAYYYIEDVFVQEIPVTPIEVDLDGPLEGCLSVTIEAGNPDYTYQWSNGSQGPSITVMESGTYSVTATLGCATAEDEVEVVILSPPTVNLGPDMILCPGESIDISLDPDIGDYTWQDGTTGPDYTITEGGLYQVTVENACGTGADALFIEAIPSLPLDLLGDDREICEGDIVSFSFDPGLGDFLWQDNSTSPGYVITTSGTYSLTITNACGTVEDEIEVTVLGPPPMLPVDTIPLCPGESFLVELDPDLADYLWEDGSTDAEYFISQPGTYTVTATNDCGDVIGVIEAIGLDLPGLDLGPDVTLCAGDTITLGLPGLEGSPVWQNGATTPVLNVDSPGLYILTLSNACGSVVDSVTVFYSDTIAAPDLGPDVTLCPGQTEVLFVQPAGATITWSDGSSADSLIVSQSGLYSVSLSTACQVLSDTIEVTIDAQPPSFAFPDTLRLCTGDTVRLDPQLTSVDFLWNTGAITSFLDVTSPGLYALTVSNACGTGTDSVFILDAGPVPAVSLGNDTTVCVGDTFSLKPIFDAVDTWSWFDGSTSAGYLITGPGTYSIAVQNACGTATDTAVISSLRAPDPVDLGPDTTLCPGESVTLAIDASTGNVQWPDGSGGSMFITADSGWVDVNISNVCGTVTDSLWVSIAPPLPALDLGPDQSICPGETILIDPGIAGVGYLWQDGSTGSQFQTAIPGNIILTISDACGSASDTLALVESNDPPMLVPGPDVTACAGEQVILDAGISGVEYAWSTGESGSQIAVTASGVYVLSVENACGTDTDTVEVSFADPPPLQDLGPDRTLCEGEAIVLLAIPNGTDAVTWSDSSTFPQLIVDAAGTYSVSVTNACGTTSDSVAITYLAPPPDVALGPDTLLCPGDTLTLIAPDPAFDIAWQDGQAGSTYDVVVGGTYVLTLSNVCGTSGDSITVQFSETVPTLALPDQLALCPGESVILDATLPIQAEYNWNTGATTPSIAAEAPGQYWVEVTYPCGSVKDTIEIIRDEDCEADLAITFPNVFSPNGDGVNDVFTYSASTSSAVRALEGQIFDRWGNMVYRSTADPFVWDGRFQGDILNPGVFVYVIRLSILSAGNEEVRQFAGDVTVMR